MNRENKWVKEPMGKSTVWRILCPLDCLHSYFWEFYICTMMWQDTFTTMRVCTMLLCFCGFHGNKNRSRIRRERPDMVKTAWRIRNPWTVLGSRICYKSMHLTVNSLWVANWSTLKQFPHFQNNKDILDPIWILPMVTYDLN